MKIDHIALYVNDLENTKSFFEKYFHATANEKYRNPNSGFESYFLSLENSSRLEIMTKPELSDSGDTLSRFGYAHIAISVGTKDTVDALTQRLKNDGYTVISGPRTTGDDYYESCILGIEGNLIEITV